MAQWRSTAYKAWSVQTSPALPSWISSVTALSDAALSLDTVVTLVAAHYNSSTSGFNVARVNFAQDKEQVLHRHYLFRCSSSRLSSVVEQKDSILAKVLSTPSGQVALATNVLTAQTLAAAFCPILKLSETRLTKYFAAFSMSMPQL